MAQYLAHKGSSSSAQRSQVSLNCQERTAVRFDLQISRLEAPGCILPVWWNPHASSHALQPVQSPRSTVILQALGRVSSLNAACSRSQPSPCGRR